MPGDPVDTIQPERREVLRRALVELRREGVDLTVRVLLERARALAGAAGAPRTQHVGWALAAYRAGRFSLEGPAGPPAPPPSPPPAPAPPPERREVAPPPPAVRGAPTAEDIASLVAGVDSHEKTLDATREVMRALALGVMACAGCGSQGPVDHKVGGLLIKGLQEARQSIKGAALEGGTEVDNFLPATAEAVGLVELFEGITCDDRRELVLAFVAAELEADQRSGPGALAQTSTGGTA